MSHFADARFFKEDDALKETIPSTITYMGKGDRKNVLQVPKEGTPTHQLKNKESKQGGTPSSVKQINKKVATSTWSTSIVLSYIPKSRKKYGESPFRNAKFPKI